MKIADLLKAWQKTPNESLRTLILAEDDREPLAELRGLEALKTGEIAERLGRFRSKAKDPRVTRALETLLLEARWSSDAAKPMWRAVFDLVPRTGDPRLKHLRPPFKVRPAMAEWLGRQLEKAVESLPEAFPATDEGKWKQALAAQDAAPRKPSPGQRDEAGLLAAVYANPFDDAPRLVLADFLTEKGDPRGEFIALQCGPRDAKREAALLKAHGKQWLAPFGPVLGATVEWRRGFPAKGLARFKSEGDVKKYGSLPAWSTFEELTWFEQGSATDRRWTRHVNEHFAGLRRASGPFLPGLLASKRPFEQLEVLDALVPDTKALRELVGSPLFPRLHTLRLDGPVLPSWLAGLPSLGTVKTLRLRYETEYAAWLTHARSLAGLEAVEFDELLRFTRDDQGGFTRLTVLDNEVARKHQYWGLGEKLPDGLFSSVSYENEAVVPKAQRDALAKQVGAVQPAPAPRAAGEVPPLVDRPLLAWLDDTHVVASQEGQLLVIDVSASKPRLVRTLPAPRGLAVLAALPGGETLLAGSKGKLLAIDAASGDARFELPHRWMNALAFDLSEDGARASRGNAGVFDLVKRAPVPPPRGAKEDTRAPDDSAALRFESGKAPELRVPGQRLGRPLEAPDRAQGFFFVKDGVVARQEARLVKWSLADGRVAAALPCREAHLALAVPSTGKRFVGTLDGDRTALVAALPALTEHGRLKFEEAVEALAVRGDGRRVAAVCGEALLVAEV